LDLSSLIEKNDMRLVDESQGLPDPDVEWVHTTELLDPSMYLSGGELILTTGLWRHRRSDAGRFIGTLKEAGVSAVGYGLPARDTEIPSDVRAACSEEELCLVEIPYDTPFIAISRSFVEWLAAAREKWLVEALRRSETMTNSLRREQGIDGILRILQRDLELDAAVITGSGETTVQSAGAEWPNELPSLADQLRSCEEFPLQLALEGGDLTVFAVRTPGPDHAFLVLAIPLEKIADEQRTAIDQALAFLAVELASRRAVRATELRFSGELLDLISMLPARLPELQDRLEGLGMDATSPMTVLSATAVASGGGEPEVLAIERTIATLGLRALVIARGDGHFLLTNAADGELDAIAEQVLESLRADREVTAASVGIGSLVADAGDLRISLSEARQACTLAANRKEAYAIARADEAGSHDLLLAVADSEIRATFAARLIEPLHTYDKRRGAELIRTVSAFLENGCKWQLTAEELNVHVNTLRHRLSRIEELTGRDLNEMEARVDFFLALRADRMTAEHKIREPSPHRQPG